ncbi:MAG: radical SAM protein [Deltaproteobacteria bacterium]|nr:radical SAM protein [Deltaproteobacteria bacterium]MBW1737966.1 radical SAM protein [Deltaproteobacteria bacterium]MBW1908196.1 radical SAM protein [Deltaproteobacteria bacterium]MBW2035049.1 radical SAM protein [Deltaproteobacteria bacterium]MBW2115342.1 radical SAM protein [Deltaproteobacteria bacterium]
MGTCQYCGKSSMTISGTIGFCVDCIRGHFDKVWPEIKHVHQKSRRAYGLPEDPPRVPEGISCSLCVRECSIPEGGTGYCGLRRVENGLIRGGRPHEGNLSYYYDPLPTNCVGDFVCPGGTGSGYPRYAVSNGPEYGHMNLAVFYHACSFNCLYCQNYHFKEKTFSSQKMSAKALARAVDKRTTCICYFGGDPTPQILHALKTSKLALNEAGDRILRICWETNGALQEPFLTRMADLSLKSGGCIKFDLKAWDEGLHHALCGVTNQKTLENFRALAGWIEKRSEPPFLIASTLLVPGYIDEDEVAGIAKFISGLNPEIPYNLLAFYPHFYLRDLPTTSRAHAMRCKEVAEKSGLKHVRIGNIHLLGEDY